jgi:hypothetical protein
VKTCLYVNVEKEDGDAAVGSSGFHGSFLLASCTLAVALCGEAARLTHAVVVVCILIPLWIFHI